MSVHVANVSAARADTFASRCRPRERVPKAPSPIPADPRHTRTADVVSIHSRLQNIENIDYFDFA
ncbi:hypothetical protein CWD92_24620 [Burkholderia thailandensis]|nr:hypothetical protein A8H32_30120 [Burkholderia thailandensis]PJO69762.1 hypothetical protein CWD92_24620 [Burkholderia thailandensis]